MKIPQNLNLFIDFNKFLSEEDFEVIVGKVFYGDKSFVFKAQVDDLNEKDPQ